MKKSKFLTTALALTLAASFTMTTFAAGNVETPETAVVEIQEGAGSQGTQPGTEEGNLIVLPETNTENVANTADKDLITAINSGSSSVTDIKNASGNALAAAATDLTGIVTVQIEGAEDGTVGTGVISLTNMADGLNNYRVVYLDPTTNTWKVIKVAAEDVDTENKTVTVSLPSGAQAVVVADDSVAQFVERMYTVAFNRKSDPKGKQSWYNQLTEKRKSAEEIVQGFFNSAEYKNKELTDEAFLTDMYQTIFNRQPDAAGMSSWMKKLAAGTPREEVVLGFTNSAEFTKLCNNYSVAKNKAAVAKAKVEDFVERLYNICLSRNSDAAGKKKYVDRLVAEEKTGAQVANDFVFSKEFTGKGLTNEDYVKALYAAFFGREADKKGLDSWVAMLNAGTSRKSVFNGFVGSQEFMNLCASYGIKAK